MPLHLLVPRPLSSLKASRLGARSERGYVCGRVSGRQCRHRVRAQPTSDKGVQRNSTTETKREALKTQLLELLGEGTSGAQRMARVPDSRKRLEVLVNDLCSLNPTEAPVESELLLGSWQLLTTFKAGTADVDFFSAESWRKYVYEQGPSPVQSLVLGNSSSVSNVSQILESPLKDGSKWQNVVSFGEGNKLVIEAALEGVRDKESFYYRFSGGFFSLAGGRRIPYPVPFGVLEALRPGQTKGWFSTTYLDQDIRVSQGNKGSIFVLCRPPGDPTAQAAPLIT